MPSRHDSTTIHIRDWSTEIPTKSSKRGKKLSNTWLQEATDAFADLLSLGDRHFEEAEFNKERNSRGMEKKQKVKYGNLRARSRALNGFSASILSPTPYGKILRLARYRGCKEIIEESLLHPPFHEWKRTLGQRTSRDFRGLERSWSDVWAFITFKVSLWTSTTKSLCNYSLGLILLDRRPDIRNQYFSRIEDSIHKIITLDNSDKLIDTNSKQKVK
ncbi:hypothetical protein SDJN02_24216, partial [Cucurbita argyrosperma subsp. argyrosperma]